MIACYEVREINIVQRIVMLWIVLLFVSPLVAQEAELHLGEHNGPVELYQYVDYLKHEGGGATLQNIIDKPAHEWQAVGGDTPNFGYSDAAFWFRFTVSRIAGDSSHLIEISYPLLDELTLYEVLETGSRIIATIGDGYPFDKRLIDHRNFLFPVNLPAEKAAIYYLRVKTSSSVQVPMTIWEERSFFEDATWQAIVQGVFFGIMLVMVLYNGFVFIVVRDISYFYYVLYVTSFALLQATLYGFAYQYVWPNNIWWNDKAVAFFIPCTLFLVLLFTRVFLDLKSKILYSSKKNYPLAITSFLLVFDLSLVMGACIFPYVIMIKLCIVAALVNSGAIIFIGFNSLFRGNDAAKYFCLAWVTLLISVIVYASNKFGWIPRSFFTENFMQIGSAAEVILLSFALADRFNKERQDKYEAQQLALSHALKAQEEHDKLVTIQKESHEKEVLSIHKIIEAEAESKAKTQFLATMSHEIRTPMNGVIGMAELMFDTSLNGQQRNYLDVIRNSGQSLLTIINDILDYAKIAAGEMELEKIDVDISVLVQDCVEMFRPMAEKKKVEIGSLINIVNNRSIVVDPTRLRQIITNLISNALKFTEDGYVCVEVFEVDSTSANNRLRIEVQDTGIGISQENQQKLFAAFKQADASTTRRFGGTGLGLSICKQLVELMGGVIGVESSAGCGAKFWFEIEMNSSHQAVPAIPGSMSNESVLNAPIHCLLLTKKPLVRRLMEAASSSVQSLTVRIISDAAMAGEWERSSDLSKELIIVDQDWPAEAFQVIRRLQEKSQFSLNIGLMVRMGFELSKDRRAEIGVRFLMQKPLSVDEVVENIAQLTGDNDQRHIAIHKKLAFQDYSHLRVLIAEDNPVNQMVIVGMLGKFNIQTEVAENGKLALEKFQTASYDFVLMDCEMPIMDGFEATRQMRRFEHEKSLAKTPIIALTAHAMKEYKEKFYEVGMDAYLVKPITLDRLGAILQNTTQGLMGQTG
ncbi:hypothetical protein A9Q81_07875 [Gammaproteobacteria bacterium 42_54_T18]|nr:hypothetical protein A9Q81_07875 [Gammaproteobacteria bacterium 42_54_T18]